MVKRDIMAIRKGDWSICFGSTIARDGKLDLSIASSDCAYAALGMRDVKVARVIDTRVPFALLATSILASSCLTNA
jgi:hypothetical protein